LFPPWPSLPVQLMTVAIFWGWLGFLLDRRRGGLREPLIRGKRVRGALYTLGVMAAFLFLVVGVWALVRDYRVFAYLPKLLEQSNPHPRLLGRQVHELALVLWSVVYVAYFSTRLLKSPFRKNPAAKFRQVVVSKDERPAFVRCGNERTNDEGGTTNDWLAAEDRRPKTDDYFSFSPSLNMYLIEGL
jgi:hypothetical protein